MDQVTLRRKGIESVVEGRIEITAQDGGILLMARDGEIWLVPPDEQVKHTHNDAPFRPFSPANVEGAAAASCPRASTSTRRHIT